MRNTWKKTAVLGGDRRMCAAACRLAQDGHTVTIWGTDGAPDHIGHAVQAADWHSAIAGADVILLPIPASGDSVRIKTAPDVELRFMHLLEACTNEQRIFGGRFPPGFKSAADERGICLHDYAENELFAIRNARPTAEGAIEIALRSLPVTLQGCSTVIIGFGRIGQVLAPLLHALGAEVTIAARKATDLTRIGSYGYTPYKIAVTEAHSSLCGLKNCRVIFNTAPHWLFTHEVLAALRPDVCLIDLASAPGGVDPQAAAELGINVIRAPGLPGKCAPETAGIIIAETLLDMLAWEGVHPL